MRSTRRSCQVEPVIQVCPSATNSRSTAAVVWLDVGSARERAVDVAAWLEREHGVDLGGLHPPLSKTVDLDAQAAYLGITPGGTYPMDIFHAERHTDQSNFRIDTSIQCFIPQ